MSGVPLAAVKGRRRLGGVPFALGLAAILVAGMVGLLALNIAIQSGSAELRHDQTQAKSLNDELAALRAEVDRVSSATNLAQQAAALGMRPDTNGVFLHLADGSVTGDAKPASGSDVPNSVPAATSTSAPIQITIYPAPTPTVSATEQPSAVAADGPVTVPASTPTGGAGQ